jgi:flagellar basal body-associated protein FliL
MTANIKTPGPGSSARRRALRLRIIAVIVLLLGIVGAELIYWRGTGSGDLSDDPSMLGYDKAASRQVGTLYGQQGVMVQEWSNDLKEPGTRAVIIVVAAALVAGGCFYFAWLLDKDGQYADKNGQ